MKAGGKQQAWPCRREFWVFLREMNKVSVPRTLPHGEWKQNSHCLHGMKVWGGSTMLINGRNKDRLREAARISQLLNCGQSASLANVRRIENLMDCHFSIRMLECLALLYLLIHTPPFPQTPKTTTEKNKLSLYTTHLLLIVFILYFGHYTRLGSRLSQSCVQWSLLAVLAGLHSAPGIGPKSAVSKASTLYTLLSLGFAIP